MPDQEEAHANQMDGERLIAELCSDPARFAEEHKAVLLLKAYFDGFRLETLRSLIKSDDENIKSVAAFIVSELRGNAVSLIDDIIELLKDRSPSIQWDALEALMCCAVGDHSAKFLLVVEQLKNQHRGIRLRVMRLICNADNEQIDAALGVLLRGVVRGREMEAHRIGLELLRQDTNISMDQFKSALNSDDEIIRKYAAIVAARVSSEYPSMLQICSESFDLEVSEFSQKKLAALN